MLVVGTEQGSIHFLAPSGNEIKNTIQLGSVPVSIVCEGQYDVDYKCYAACRSGKILVINNKGSLE